MNFLKNKRALIIGVANNRSIAYGIANAMHRAGSELAFTYQNEKLQSRVEKFADQLDSKITIPCDLANDEDIQQLYQHLQKHWDNFDILVHSAAFAPREQLEGDYLDSVTREGFRIAHDISSYSLAALAKCAKPMMQARNSAILTLSYIGAVRSMPNYNVMGLAKASLEANVRYMAASLGGDGIRVNGISAGPIKTLAASGISGLKKFLSHVENVSPLGRNVTIDEIGNTAAFLCSDLASAITGEIIYADCGYHSVGIGHNQ